MFYCGIDIAKYKHEATVIDESGNAMLDSISFANSKMAVRSCWHCFKDWMFQEKTCLLAWRPHAITG